MNVKQKLLAKIKYKCQQITAKIKKSSKHHSKTKPITSQSTPSNLPNNYSINHTNSKFSWYHGAKVLYQQQECTIHTISATPNTPDLNDAIVVEFDNGLLQIYQRYELDSTLTYVSNRHKLTPCCSIDIYCPFSKQWIPAYIDHYGKLPNSNPNKKSFSVNGKTYQRWSNQIRCSLLLSNLKIASNIFVFNNVWNYSKIMDVIQFENKLDIFEVYYHQNNKIYLKYTHQYSSAIALMTAGAQCSVTDEKIANAKMVHTDETDFKYYLLLIKGYMQEKSFQHRINSDVVSILIKYIGCLYELIIIIESKTCKSRINKRDSNYMPILNTKTSNPHRKMSLSISIFSDIGSDVVPRSPTPMHPTEEKLKNKLIERGDKYNNESNFQKAKHLAQNEKAYYVSLIEEKNVSDEDKDYEEEIMTRYNNLPFPNDGYDEIVRDEYESDDNKSMSLETGWNIHMDLPSDWEKSGNEVENRYNGNDFENDLRYGECQIDNNDNSLSLESGENVSVPSDWENECEVVEIH